MFHRFSAAPAKGRSPTKGSGSVEAPSYPNLEHAATPLAKRQKTARACDRCRLHRIKCDEQKPCTQCVSIRVKCVVSYAPPRSSQANSSGTDHARCESSSSAPSRPDNGSRGSDSAKTGSSTAKTCGSTTTNNNSPASASAAPPRMSMSQESSAWAAKTSPDNGNREDFALASHVQAFFASGQPALSPPSALAGCLFPQLPHPPVTSGERAPVSDPLLKNQWSYYLRLFRDVCHPLLQIMSEAEFAELDGPPPLTMSDRYSARSALIDSMVALGIQHSHITGLAARILGLQQPQARQDGQADTSAEASWPGFDYFHRCRERMRTNTEVSLDALRSHALMALYLIKGSAFRDAYNMLGITVRKAYIAKLHRLPPSHLPEAGRTAHMQLWWTIFSLDLQCSLQLDMPAASQKSLVKCPFPTEDALARYVSSPNHRNEGMSACTYSTRLVNLAVIVADIGACVSTADLVDDDGSGPAALEHDALNLSSALQTLEAWRTQLPPELRLSRGASGGPGNTEMLDFGRDLALPAWLQRQAVLLELHYHNAYTLIQRPFIRLRYGRSTDAGGMITPPNSRQPHVELHIASALHHSILIVDTVFTVYSMSDILYGWPEVLQPLWNATLTIMAYIYANSLSSVVPRALDSLTRAQAVFQSFSPTCPTAQSAKAIVQSLANSLQNMMAHGACVIANDSNHDSNPMSWDLFASLLEEQQTPLTGIESGPSTNDLYGSMLFSPFMASASPINTPDFNAVVMPFGDS
ncbi:hypothetical protein DV736_g6104, partial [Chaetothyriales sp. CBS 134916]